MLKLIVFDCDGVMFDSRDVNRMYYNDLLGAFGRTTMDEQEIHFVHSHNVTDSVTHIFRHYADQDLEAVHRHRAELSYTPYLAHMKMEPDLVEFLNWAQPSYKLAISTNRTTTMKPLLDTYELSGYFEKVVTAMDVKNPKPAPDALFEILSYFGCNSAQTIFIGDSEIDRQHSQAAGVELIAFKNKSLDAQYHVQNFMDILALEPFRCCSSTRLYK